MCCCFEVPHLVSYGYVVLLGARIPVHVIRSYLSPVKKCADTPFLEMPCLCVSSLLVCCD